MKMFLFPILLTAIALVVTKSSLEYNYKDIWAAIDRQDTNFIIHYNGNVNGLDYCNMGQTALSYVAVLGYTESAKALIVAGADVNQVDEPGWTALMWASINGEKEIVKILIDNKANVNMRANNGWTALSDAELWSDVIIILKKAGVTNCEVIE